MGEIKWLYEKQALGRKMDTRGEGFAGELSLRKQDKVLPI